jgi:hypothetical protein
LGKLDSWLANFIKCIEVQDKKGLIYSATKLKLLQTKNFYTIISTIEKPFCGSVCTKTNRSYGGSHSFDKDYCCAKKELEKRRKHR